MLFKEDSKDISLESKTIKKTTSVTPAARTKAKKTLEEESLTTDPLRNRVNLASTLAPGQELELELRLAEPPLLVLVLEPSDK